MGRGIAVALALSLAVNVFLGGFVVGKIVGKPHFGAHPPGFSLGRGAHEDFADLTPAARESLKRVFIAHRREGAEMRREANALHREFTAALGADVFDRAKAEAIVDRIAAVERSGRAGMARLIVEAADGLPAEDRKALARHLDRRGEKRFMRHFGPRRRDDGEAPPGGPPPEGPLTEEPPAEDPPAD
ncbi:MAG: periplasmic heavy metal sensor [Pseudomonadota bacterium]